MIILLVAVASKVSMGLFGVGGGVGVVEGGSEVVGAVVEMGCGVATVTGVDVSVFLFLFGSESGRITIKNPVDVLLKRK